MKIVKQSAHIVKEWSNMNLYERCEFAGRISHASEDKIKEGSAEEFVRRMVKLGHESVFEFARMMFIVPNEHGELQPLYINIRTLRELLRNGQRQLFCAYVNSKYPRFFEDIEKVSPKSFPSWVKEANDWIPVLITTNRAISHQLVRYRKDVVYLQQSQRYVKFHDDIDFISPDVYFPETGNIYQQENRQFWENAMRQAEENYKFILHLGASAQAARLFLLNSTATKLIMYASLDTWRHVFEQRISDKADPMIRELLEPLKEEFAKEGLL